MRNSQPQRHLYSEERMSRKSSWNALIKSYTISLGNGMKSSKEKN